MLTKEHKILSFFVFIALLFPVFTAINPAEISAADESKTVKVGVYDNEPKVYRDENSEMTGVWPDILNYIASQENWHIDYVYGTWEEGLTRLENGEIDIMVDVAISEERQELYDFTNETVLGSWGVIYVNKDSTIENWQDLTDKKVAILESSVYYGGPQGVDTYVHAFGLNTEFVIVDQYDEVFTLLNSGEVDAIVVSRITGLNNEKTYPEIKQTNIIFNPTELRFALTKGDSDNQYLIEKLDYWVSKLKDGYDNVYIQILERYNLEEVAPGLEVTPKWVIPLVVTGSIAFIILLFILFQLIRKRITSIRELSESENKFSKVFQTSPYAITISRAIDGSFIDVNDFFTTNTGYSREEALNNSSVGLKLWVNNSDRQYMLNELKAGRNVVNKEFLFRMKNGNILNGLFSSQLIQLRNEPCILSSIADITDSKKMEQKVLELKERNDAILESIADAVVACDKDGIIVVFNRVAEEITGISAREAIGNHHNKIVTLIDEDTGKPSGDCISKAVLSNKTVKINEHTLLIAKDGSKIPVVYAASPIKEAKGNIIGCVVVFHDVTKERQVDKAKTEFVSLASHQLRTPLSTINWYAEMLLAEDVGKLTTKQRKYSQEVYHASQRMVNLVNSLLNVSRLELGTFSISPKKVDIIKIAKTCIKELEPTIIEKKLVITQHFDGSVSSYKADPRLLKIIVQNLLVNSVRYTNNEGKIDITISKEKDGIQITVSDNGIGIPKAQQSQIFGKLFRADNAKMAYPDGTGLGLYIVKQIIQHSGGKINFKSDEGKGTVFYVTLPLSGMNEKIGKRNLT